MGWDVDRTGGVGVAEGWDKWKGTGRGGASFFFFLAMAGDFEGPIWWIWMPGSCWASSVGVGGSGLLP